MQLTETSSLPAMFDFSPFSGDPDPAPARSSGPSPLCRTAESASYAPPGGVVTAGFWEAAPTECGPYPPGGAPAGTATVAMTRADQGVRSGRHLVRPGDIWHGGDQPGGVVLAGRPEPGPDGHGRT